MRANEPVCFIRRRASALAHLRFGLLAGVLQLLVDLPGRLLLQLQSSLVLTECCLNLRR